MTRLKQRQLEHWAQTTQPPPYPLADTPRFDYHRAQIEKFLWDNRDRMEPLIVDIGGEWVRPYIPEAVIFNPAPAGTMSGFGMLETSQEGSVLALPWKDGEVQTVLCTETLEHIPNLFKAVGEIKRVVAKGGHIFISAPFLWPWHGTYYYEDYWRLTRDSYYFLFADCASVEVTAIEHAQDALPYLDGVREVSMQGGLAVEYATGYLTHIVR